MEPSYVVNLDWLVAFLEQQNVLCKLIKFVFLGVYNTVPFDLNMV